MADPNSKLPFLEIIDWVEDNPNILMQKFCDEDSEIKNGAKLIVRSSQKALLLSGGIAADLFEEGTFTLKTENIPVLSNLKSWKYGFESPFKADVYFFSVKQFVNLKWGTPAPIIMRDSQFGQVRVKAFGSYNVRIFDVVKFFREYAGTYSVLTIFELEQQLRDFIAPKFGEILAQAGFSVLDLAGNLTELSAKIRPLIAPYFENLGVEVTEFTISSVTLPQEVTVHFDNVTSMNMIGDMNRYTQFQQANALGKEGSAVQNQFQQGAAMGMMINAMQAQQNSQPKNPEPDDAVQKLTKLKSLFDAGLIDEDEFKAKKAEILSSI